MKKLFASLMAATMVAGMSVSAFAYVGDNDETPAADNEVTTKSGDLDDDYGFDAIAGDANGTVYGGDKLYAPILVDVKSVEDEDAPANTVEGDYFYATKASEVEDLKVSVKETEGKGTIKEVNIVRKAADKFGVDTVTGKIYGIEIKLNDYFKTEESELEFDLTLKEKGKEQLKVEDFYFDLGQDDDNSILKGEAAVNADGIPYYINVDGEENDLKPGTGVAVGYWFANESDAGDVAKACVNKDMKVVVPTDATAVTPAFKEVVLAKDVKDGYGFGYDAKFKENSGLLELTVGEDTKAVTLDEADKTYFDLKSDDNNKIEELYMETADGEMFVEGLLEEQDPLFLEFTKDPTDFQKSVMVENDKADIDTFVWSAAPTFDFNMDVRVPVEDDRDNFLYEVIDGKLVEVDAELNDDGDELEFRTKTLGEYLLSDKELTAEKAEKAEAKEDAKEDTKADAKEEVKENAETGASIVAIATAIALF